MTLFPSWNFQLSIAKVVVVVVVDVVVVVVFYLVLVVLIYFERLSLRQGMHALFQKPDSGAKTQTAFYEEILKMAKENWNLSVKLMKNTRVEKMEKKTGGRGEGGRGEGGEGSAVFNLKTTTIFTFPVT